MIMTYISQFSEHRKLSHKIYHLLESSTICRLSTDPVTVPYIPNFPIEPTLNFVEEYVEGTLMDVPYVVWRLDIPDYARDILIDAEIEYVTLSW